MESYTSDGRRGEEEKLEFPAFGISIMVRNRRAFTGRIRRAQHRPLQLVDNAMLEDRYKIYCMFKEIVPALSCTAVSCAILQARQHLLT